jgi:hypothetical protein
LLSRTQSFLRHLLEQGQHQTVEILILILRNYCSFIVRFALLDEIDEFSKLPPVIVCPSSPLNIFTSFLEAIPFEAVNATTVVQIVEHNEPFISDIQSLESQVEIDKVALVKLAQTSSYLSKQQFKLSLSNCLITDIKSKIRTRVIFCHTVCIRLVYGTFVQNRKIR